jgi:HAD superfamily hydrolase (TIGR01549 family)
MEVFRKRQLVEAEIGRRQQEKGFDDEYEIEEVLQRCLVDLIKKPVSQEKVHELVDILVQKEIEQEIAVTYLDNDILSLLETIQFQKLYIISDFYMSADKVKTIFASHQFPFSVDDFFISCDSKCNKRSGRLFQHVCIKLEIQPSTLTHIGDNSYADVEMAQKCGINAIHFKNVHENKKSAVKEHYFHQRAQKYHGTEEFLFSTSKDRLSVDTRTGEDREKLRHYGRFMSPLFSGFALYIQELCCKNNHSRVHFFTREGAFFKRIFDRVQKKRMFGLPVVQSHLLPVSRLSTFLPSLQDFSLNEMMRMWSQYNIQSINSFLSSLEIDPTSVLSRIGNFQFDPEELIASPWEDERFARLFSNPEFVDILEKEHGSRRKNLVAFLHQNSFGDDGRAFIVDIGWRGTIQDNLAAVFKNVAIEGCYIGLQEFFNKQPKNTIKHGYVADKNRGEDHILLKYVMPFEMLCFSTGGSTIGYSRDDSGKVIPKKQVDPEEDRIHNQRIAFFQEGVLEGVDHVCDTASRHGVSVAELRHEARMLARHFLTAPPLVICQAFDALKQDDTFGMARTIYPGEKSFNFTDRILSYFSSAQRNRFLEDLERSGWPQSLLRTRYYGLFYHLGRLKRRVLGRLSG